MNRDPDCREINIVGDAVWCVVNTPKKSDINFVFSTACMIHTLVKVLNCKLEKKWPPAPSNAQTLLDCWWDTHARLFPGGGRAARLLPKVGYQSGMPNKRIIP